MADHKALLAELGIARGDLEALRAANLRRLMDARSALCIEMLGNLPQDVVCFIDDEGADVTLARLPALIDLFESEERNMAELLTIVERKMGASARDVDGIS